MLTPGSPPPTATKEDILNRIRALAPHFRERAAAAEAARRLPTESVQEMVQAGLARILVPLRFGGYGLGLDCWVEAVMEISKADASHGWCAALMTHHPHYLGQCSEAAQQAVWADGPDALVAASVMPTAQVMPANGGYRISGRAPFASGVDHSEWAFVGGFVPTEEGPEWRLFIVGRDDYRVADSWFTAGMCATGSNTIVTDDVFVGENCSVRMSDLRDGTGPGGIVNDSSIFRAPLVSFAPMTFAAPMLGAAIGAYEHFRDWTKTRKTMSGAAMAEAPAIQVRLARTAADLDAAALLLHRAVEVAQAGVPASLELRARSMRDCTRAAEFAVEAIDALMAMSGTAGFASSHPLQRAWRDIHFASMHASIGPERNFIHFGRMEFGLPRDPQQMYY